MYYCHDCTWQGMICEDTTVKCPHCAGTVRKFPVGRKKHILKNWGKRAKPATHVSNMGFKNIQLEDIARAKAKPFAQRNTTPYTSKIAKK